MNTHDIELPPLPDGYGPSIAAAMRDYARAAIEAALQSPEVQAWRKDAERLNWIEEQFGAEIACDDHNEWWVDWAEGYVEATSMRDAIDHARRVEGEG